ncbi:MAG: caspase family protein [Candidatus Thorarchaeota archaeon]|nr:caspase family protein [Candidatus Thorarchaeota archaeon]
MDAEVDVVVRQPGSDKPQHWAVVVGISDYKAIGDLNFCDEDANDWFTYLSYMGYEHIVVLGDDTSPYLQYDGIATEYNVKRALMDVVTNAGEKDTIAFITSGHGSGDSRGLSLLCLWDITAGEDGEDGYFYDYELADILEHAVARDVFVFIDHCFAGGFGDDFMAMPNAENVYFAATCTERGMGWDAGEYENGMWTYFFLEYTLIGVFGSDPGTTMEDAFAVAETVYPFHIGAHHPEAYDGDLIHEFLLW